MCKSNRIDVIEFDDKYAVAAVKMWRDSKERALGIPENYSFDDHLLFLRETLTKTDSIFLAIDRDTGHPVGLMATDGTFLNQLYVHIDFQQSGIGTMLLNHAKETSNGRIKLYTFEHNRTATQFYQKNGFKLIGRGHDNEEELPDLLYEWRSN